MADWLTAIFNKSAFGIDPRVVGFRTHFTQLMRAYSENNISGQIEGCNRPDAFGELARAFQAFKTNCESWQTSDADAAEAKRRADEERRLADEQLINGERDLVGRSIGKSLTRLAAHDLSIRLTANLPEAYRGLQGDFNAAVQPLEVSLQKVSMVRRTDFRLSIPPSTKWIR